MSIPTTKKRAQSLGRLLFELPDSPLSVLRGVTERIAKELEMNGYWFLPFALRVGLHGLTVMMIAALTHQVVLLQVVVYGWIITLWISLTLSLNETWYRFLRPLL